jgi:DNA-directed RNA polymerase subunit beta
MMSRNANDPGIESEKASAVPSNQLRAFDDYAQTRSNIEQNVVAAVGSKFPLENSRYRIELSDPSFEYDREFALSDQKKALMTKGSLYKNFSGRLKLFDVESGSLVEDTGKPIPVARVPYMTHRGTFINKGNEYTVTNQARLMEGVYSRRKKSGEYEAHFNTLPGKGRPFRLMLEPKTGKLMINVGQSNLKFYPVLKAFGYTQDQFKEFLGEELAKTNSEYSKYDVERIYERLTYKSPKDMSEEEMLQGIREAMQNTALSPLVTKATLAPHVPAAKASAVPLRGTLKLKGGMKPFARLTVPKSFVDSVYQSIRDEDSESKIIPVAGAFLEVFTTHEISKLKTRLGTQWPTVCGNSRRYTFNITDVISLPGIEHNKEHCIRAQSKDLEDLRQSVGLSRTPTGSDSFKIIVGHSPSIKAASLVEESGDLEELLNKVKVADIGAISPSWQTQTFDMTNKDYSQVTLNTLLRATQKIFNIANDKETPDDRDSLAYQRFYGPEDFFKERIEKDAGGAVRSALFKATYRGSLNPLKSRPFDSQIQGVLVGSGLGAPIEEVNPVEIMDQVMRVTRTGEGGISASSHGIPLDTRSVQPSHLGFIDPVRTPESGKAGVDLRLTIGSLKGADGQLYTKLRGKDGKVRPVSASKATGSIVAFPGEIAKASAKGGPVRAMVQGKIQYVPAEEVDYEIPSPQSMFNINSNLVPGISGLKGGRLLMGSKFFTQALPLETGEAPLVQASDPDSTDGSSYDESLGKILGAVSSKKGMGPGVVTNVSPESITVKHGKEKVEYNLYNHFPFNRKTYIHNTSLVEPGDKVKPGQVLAKSNFTDEKGALALGKNLRVAYMAHGDEDSGGVLFEDGIIISDSAAKKLASEHLYLEGVDKDDDFTPDKNKFVSLFPGEYTDTQLKSIDTNGVVKVGTVLQPEDPIMLGVGTKNTTTYGLRKKKKQSFLNRAQTWKKSSPGLVTDVVKTPSGHQVAIRAYRPMRVGDKLVGRFGDKGVIASIVPDGEMPAGEDGKPMEVLLSSLGLISRVNPVQAVEAALGKVAAKRGKPIKFPAFMEESNIDFAKRMLKEHGLSDTENLHDPVLNKKTQAFTGNRYFMNLHFQAESKLSGRSTGSYSADEAPTKGGEEGAARLGMMDIDALLAHGAINALKDARLIRGQKNEEYWRALKKGAPTPPIEVPFIWEKFVNQLKASGVNVNRSGGHVNIYGMTNKDVKALAPNRVSTSKDIDWKTGKSVKGGLFDEGIFGESQRKFGYFPLSHKVVNPVMEDVVRNLLDLTKTKFEDVVAKKKELPNGKTGIEGIEATLKNYNVKENINNAKKSIKAYSGQKRSKAISKLAYLEAMKDRSIDPLEFIWDRMPVIPPVFRPITDTGKLRLISDPNFLYKELFDLNENIVGLNKELGEDYDDGKDRLELYQAVKAVVGLSDPTSSKLKETKVRGILQHVLGKNPKYSLFQRKVLSTLVDNTGNAVISPDPSLDMDHVGLPEKMAMKIYKPYIVRHLIKSGISPVEAVSHVKRKSKAAKNALLEEMDRRPVIITRAPVLHKYGFMGAKPVLTAGDTLKISPAIVEGFGADFDGDTMRVHVPSSQGAINDVLNKMLPSRNVLSAKDFKAPKFISNEFLLGLYLASSGKAKGKAKKVFETREDVIKAFNRGDIDVSDIVEILKD